MTAEQEKKVIDALKQLKGLEKILQDLLKK